MKNLIFIVLISVLSFNSFSQSTEILDNKFGYKGIKLDSKSSQFFNLKSLGSDERNSLYEYTPENRDLFKVYDIDFNKIILIFNKSSDELKAITLFKQYNSVSPQEIESKVFLDLKLIVARYSHQLGKPHSLVEKSKNVFSWSGDKVLLSVTSKITDYELDEMSNLTCKINLEVSFYKVDKENESTGF